jgi:hypothetical protein
MNKLILSAALAAIVLPAAPALAHDHRRDDHSDEYDRYGRYNQPHAIAQNDRVWRGRDGRYRCRRDNGTTGLVIGAIGGALVGRTVDTRGDRTLGTLLGAAGGGLLGREIDRSGSRCR